MSSNKYNDILEKYYSGQSSVEEERQLKKNAHLVQESLPLAALEADNAVMDWSFQEFLQQADQQQQPLPTKTPLRKIYLLKYAAAVVLMAMIAVAIQYTKKEATVLPQNQTVARLPEVAAQEEPVAKGSIKPVPTWAAINAVVKNKMAIVHRQTIKIPPPVAPQKNDDFFVMVDGRRITDESEALAILQQSFDALSGEMRQTMAGINNFPKLDVKLK